MATGVADRAANAAARRALILGLDTAAGAYLARLLDARGYQVAGTGGGDLLDRLGIGGDVLLHDEASAALTAASRPDEIYDLRYAPAATAALLAIAGSARVFAAASPGTASDAVARARDVVARARDAGRFAVTGTVFPHESRLGPGTSPVARIAAAAFAGSQPDAADLASVTDCGWTPEYVDAMARMLQQPKPADFAIATRRALSGVEAARHAFEYFGRDASRFTDGPGTATAFGDAAANGIGDPGPAAAVFGWRAVTWGRDLVRVLCEGVAAN